MSLCFFLKKKNSNFFSSSSVKKRAHGRLDLGGLELKSVPIDVYNLIVLISLSLDSNDLNDISEDMRRLILLQEMSAKCNKIEVFPPVLLEMPGLTVLDISYNFLTILPATGWRSLKCLRELNLSNNTLISLPDDLAALGSLETLYLEGNLLKKLPDLGLLKNLRTLVAYDNKLQSAPRNLPPQIETVDLSRNDLTTLSGSNVCSIASLETLDLSSNRLVELPRFRSPQLQELAVADNRLESLSPLEDLPLLRVLDASRNQLRTLPFSIGALGHLAEVHLRNNLLEVLPPSIGMCQSLRLLDVSDNKLEALPEELALIAGLTHVKARHNQMLWVPAKLSTLPALVELDLFNNKRIGNVPVEMVTDPETPARAILRHLGAILGQEKMMQYQQLGAGYQTLTPQSTYKTPRGVITTGMQHHDHHHQQQQQQTVDDVEQMQYEEQEHEEEAQVVAPTSLFSDPLTWKEHPWGWWMVAASAVVLATAAAMATGVVRRRRN